MCYDIRGMMAHAREMLQSGHIVVWGIHFGTHAIASLRRQRLGGGGKGGPWLA